MNQELTVHLEGFTVNLADPEENHIFCALPLDLGLAHAPGEKWARKAPITPDSRRPKPGTRFCRSYRPVKRANC